MYSERYGGLGKGKEKEQNTGLRTWGGRLATDLEEWGKRRRAARLFRAPTNGHRAASLSKRSN